MGSVNKRFEESFRRHWALPALSNYQGATLSYGQAAERIELLQLALRKAGLGKGDRVAICGKNQANWPVAYLSALTAGYVPVALLHEFHPDSISHLLQHSGAKAFFADEAIFGKVRTGCLTFNLKDFTLLQGPEGFMDEVAAEFTEKYPFGFSASNLDYFEDSPEDLAMINYTSGTSGFSKGVMLPYRSIEVNIDGAAVTAEPQMKAGDNVVAILPCAHMYGLMFETLFELSIGAHVHYLTRMPSPRIVMEAFKDIKPDLIISVPLIMEKVYKSKMKNVLGKYGRFLDMSLVGGIMRRYIKGSLTKAFGERFEEVILGGAALNPEVEEFLRGIRFRFTCGYGMTECGPLITYEKWKKTRRGSCGKPIPGVKVRIDSPDPLGIPGEVQVGGKGVFLGYYNNPEATADAFTEDGWLRTGDMGVLDKDGYLYLRGRCKCMLLGANGQNIYPEELEATINTFDEVVDSLVVEDAGALVALIYPDARKASEQDVLDLLPRINAALPPYAHVRRIEVMKQDFERTPKKSIKRYLYQK